jgi:heterogeneous nuclear ribonucleoprotein K
VPDEHTGRIIGRQGASIKEMRSVSGAHIEVEKRGAGEGNGLRVVTLSGTPEQIQVAQYLISMKLVQAKEREAAVMACDAVKPTGGAAAIQ